MCIASNVVTILGTWISIVEWSDFIKHYFLAIEPIHESQSIRCDISRLCVVDKFTYNHHSRFFPSFR